MTLETNELLKTALTLIGRPDGSRDEPVRAAWDPEIARRMAELDSGKIKPIPIEQARRRLSSAIE